MWLLPGGLLWLQLAICWRITKRLWTIPHWLGHIWFLANLAHTHRVIIIMDTNGATLEGSALPKDTTVDSGSEDWTVDPLIIVCNSDLLMFFTEYFSPRKLPCSLWSKDCKLLCKWIYLACKRVLTNQIKCADCEFWHVRRRINETQ